MALLQFTAPNLLTVILPLACWVIFGTPLTRFKRHVPWLSGFSPRLLVALTIALPWVWFRVVNRLVPEPYLDEVFHIPQATRYLEGKWSEWDDKITTPPGLYLISYALVKIEQGARILTPGVSAGRPVVEYATSILRETNALATVVVAGLALWCRHLIETQSSDEHGRTQNLSAATTTGKERASNAPAGTVSMYSLHTAFNVALFPVLFFFSGIYYTDPWSTASVMWAYRHHLQRVSAPCGAEPSLRSDLLTIVYGVATLWMRQTNVFWVVVYFGGLEVVYAIKSLARELPENAVSKEYDCAVSVSVLKTYFQLYAGGNIHDPPLSTATFYDVVWLVISVAAAAVCNLPRVLRQVWPHVCVLALFGGFVAWNGGVVLGDKSNHVATIHLAQMLYMWPMFIFFSAPLLLSCVPSFIAYLSGLKRGQHKDPSQNSTQQQQPQPRPRLLTMRLLQSLSNHYKSNWSIAVWYVSLPLAAAIVANNTIVHPFTLADNRHYMFYIFRYTIRRPTIRYLLIPAYVVCQNLCWRLLGGTPSSPPSSSSTLLKSSQQPRWQNAPFSSPFQRKAKVEPSSLPTARSPTSVQLGISPSAAAATAGATMLDHPSSITTTQRSQPLSTALLWLLATALSLVTAPLVEPRYFIVPWIMWRLLVPAWTPTASSGDGVANEEGSMRPAGNGILGGGALRALGRKVDLRLLVETVWFVVINLATMYLFLYRPYYWRDAEGNLMDDGRLQRFMW